MSGSMGPRQLRPDMWVEESRSFQAGNTQAHLPSIAKSALPPWTRCSVYSPDTQPTLIWRMPWWSYGRNTPCRCSIASELIGRPQYMTLGFTSSQRWMTAGLLESTAMTRTHVWWLAPSSLILGARWIRTACRCPRPSSLNKAGLQDTRRCSI